MIKNAPRNYSNDLDRRRQGLDSITENLLPDVETSDAGKIMKVGEDGKWHLGSDENTIIEANPEGTASEDLENLKIGSTIYAVNKPTFEVIKGIKVTIADGGEYRTDKPKIEFYDDAGNLMTYPAYTSSCDKEYAGNISLNQVCSIATGDAPGAFTYVFSDDVVVTTYHLIKLTNAGSFAGDIAKNVKIELSSDGENFITLWEDPSISWSGTSGASRILDIKTGELSDTILPIVTSADNGKVLGVVNGVWDKADAPESLPAIVSGDNYKTLYVNQNKWLKTAYPNNYGIFSGVIDLVNDTFTGTGFSYGVNKVESCMNDAGYQIGNCRIIATDSSNSNKKYYFYPAEYTKASSSDITVIFTCATLNKKLSMHQGAGGNTTVSVITT